MPPASVLASAALMRGPTRARRASMLLKAACLLVDIRVSLILADGELVDLQNRVG